MANKQTRRTVSMAATTYEAAKREAAARGITLAELVTQALRAHGVACGEDNRVLRERYSSFVGTFHG